MRAPESLQRRASPRRRQRPAGAATRRIHRFYTAVSLAVLWTDLPEGEETAPYRNLVGKLIDLAALTQLKLEFFT